jgi:hypothetical protein
MRCLCPLLPSPKTCAYLHFVLAGGGGVCQVACGENHTLVLIGEKNLWLLGDASALLACPMHLVDGAFLLHHLREVRR